MGCEVTSVYNDEIVGKIGFTQAIIDDLLQRDFRNASPMKEAQLRTVVSNIEGFTQSYASGYLFFTMVAEQECTVYSAGRFIVIQEVKTKKRKFIGNKDAVSAFAVREKLCLVGLYGGYLVLWDMEFLEVKLQVMLPEGSLSITTVGLTSKFLFATDASQPNNFSFCYDIRTAKLKASVMIPSFQPAVRAITVNDDTHVTSCADGLWFMQALKDSDQLKVIRGIFGHFPKTSMACLAKAGGYIISGGVDGYIYAWKIATMRCVKALKVHEGEISALAVKNGLVVIACRNGRVKIYSYKVTKNVKKANELKLEEEDQDEVKMEDDQDILTFVLVDTYDKEGTIFSIATSEKDPLLYYCQTRQGLLFQKRLPARDVVPSKKSLTTIQVEDLVRLNSKAEMLIYESRLYSIYMMGEKLLFLDIHKIEKGSLSLFQERVAKLQFSCTGKYLAYLPNSNEIAYASKDNKIMVAETFGKIGDAFLNANQSNFGENSRQIVAIEASEEIVSLNFIYCDGLSFLAITTTASIYIFQRDGRLNYEEKLMIKYEKEIPSPIEFEGKRLIFEKECNKWRDEKENWQNLDRSKLEEQQKLLCSKPKSSDTRWSNIRISMGQGYAIFQK